MPLKGEDAVGIFQFFEQEPQIGQSMIKLVAID